MACLRPPALKRGSFRIHPLQVHREILEAMEKRDVWALVDAVERHLTLAYDMLYSSKGDQSSPLLSRMEKGLHASQ